VEAVSRTGLEARFGLNPSPSFRLDVELNVAPSSTAALLGPNGAGKSTAVAALAGLTGIDEGVISLDGKVVDDPANGLFIPARERRVGVVFQDYMLFPHLDVVENIAFSPRSRGVDREVAATRASEWISRLGLVGTERKRPGELSGGQAQRVALARALAGEPDLLLLDEPLAALDVTTRSELRRQLAEHLAMFPGPRLLITHEPAEAFLLADEVHIIEEGSITQSGSPDDIRLRPRTAFAADLAGANLLTGEAREGLVTLGDSILRIAEHEPIGPVLLTIAPAAVSVHLERPEGSARNAWQTTIEEMETIRDRVRIGLGPPLPITAEVTPEGAAALRLEKGRHVWVAVKATEIGVESA
jgi:molybdate transport system ATP-binding protein